MPCRYDPTPDELRQWAKDKYNRDHAELLAKLDIATRAACEVFSALEKGELVSLESIAWWIAHKKSDAQRVE